MQADDLLQGLENSAVEVLDNRAVVVSMIGGTENGTVFGAMGSNVIDDAFVNAMPQPSEDAQNAVAMNSPLPDFNPSSDDTPGLG